MRPELLVRKRMLLMTAILCLLFLLVMGRLVQLTILDADELTRRGVSQWTKEGIVTARRGTIMDCHGNVLAISASAYIVSADPRLVPDAELFLNTLDAVLPLERDSARTKLENKTRGSVILKRQVDRKTVDAIRALKQESDPAAGLAAITFEEDTTRWYPYGRLLSQVLGLTNVDSVGQSGLEQQYEDVLAGQEGSYFREVDAKNRVLAGSESWYVPSQPGNSLELTIDVTIQQICEKAMRECLEVNGALSVTCIVTDVRTGGILGICMKPDYDPAEPPRSNAALLTDLMRITAVSDAYEPGSTFKILTAAAALDCGVTTPEDSFYCSAQIKVDGDTIRCWGAAHGAETMAEGLQNSCNPVFVELALRMGTDTLYRYLHAFGLGRKTGVDVPGESAGIMIGNRYVKTVDLARIGFGQSVAVTPLQMIMAANAAVNGGKLMKPRLVEAIFDQDGAVLERFAPEVVSTPIRPETSEIMRELLEKVVSEGGGKNARIAGYKIGGKTGTAQVYKEGKIVRDVHIGSFYGFAPADDPQFSVLVIVNEADVPVDYGSATAAPFARQIMLDTLQYLNIEPTWDEPQREVVVPSITGLTIDGARRTLAEAGLELLHDGVSSVVTDQLPPAGASLVEGGHVMAYTTDTEAVTPEMLVLVPDLIGMSDIDCARLTRQRGLQIELSGTGVCVRQSPGADQYVAPGSCIQVQLETP